MRKVYTFKNLSKQKMCHHLVTQKDNSLAYSFSLALHTNENPSKILQNRDELKKLYPHMHFIVANQTHSSNIKIIKKSENLGWNSLDDAIEDCDALITNQRAIMLTILTADCVPILLFDPIKRVVGAIHAGWRGTQQQIALKTVQKMQEVFNSNPKDIIASIAPSIGECCYEVDWSVAQHFKTIPHAFTKKNQKYMLNLPFINQQQLLQSGLLKSNIELSNICTACNVEEYFSYRREKGCSGRFMSMIGLN